MPDDPGQSSTISFLIVILFGVLGAIYAAGESFFANVNESKLRKSAESGDTDARKLQKILKHRSENFSTFQFGLILSAALAVAYSSLAFSPILVQCFSALSKSTAQNLALFCVAIVTLAVFFVCCDFIPKKITAYRMESAGYKRAGLLCFLHYLVLPFLFLFTKLSDLFLRLLGFRRNHFSEGITEEEIMLLVDESEEKGVIEETEKEMIGNIFDFNDTTVSEIMTHRTSISALPDTATIEEMISSSVEGGFSRIPVYHEDIDTIVGILYIKDLIPYVGKQVPDFISILDIVRPAYFIPETKKCSQLFRELTNKRIQIAVVVDEYGGTSGLITLEDLVESILGNIQDEYDNEEEDITKVSDYEFTVDGSTSIDEISDLTGVELPEGDYDTIAGLVTDQLGRIVKENEHPTIEISDLIISVTEVEDQRISRLSIKRKFSDPDNQPPSD